MLGLLVMRNVPTSIYMDALLMIGNACQWACLSYILIHLSVCL
jgi:hypothetical protein